MPRVVLEHLTKDFPRPNGKSIRAVSDLGLTIDDHEWLVLVGPSGCGKTTTLRLLAGLDEATAGTISIDGRVMNDVPAKDRNLAMVFQSPALYPHLPVYDNLAFGLEVRKYAKAEIAERVRQAADLLGLGNCLTRLPMALSGGERQRVAIGRALVRRPELFLLDEPLSNLDPQIRTQLRSELAALHRRLESTMLHVTHDQAEAMMLGDRVAVMQAGRLQQVGKPLEVYRHPANLFVAGFIGSPPMNRLAGQLLADAGALYFEHQSELGAPSLRLRLANGATSPLLAYAGKNVVLGIRPEHILPMLLAADGSLEQAVTATLERIEITGADAFLRANGGGRPLVVRARADEDWNRGDQVMLRFDMNQALFFDPDTERAILGQ